MRPLAILFAKAPVPGRVKTRLNLPDEVAAGLHRAFVADMLDMLTANPRLFDTVLAIDISTGAWSDYKVERWLQAPGGLGEKMLDALKKALGSGRGRAIIIGSDAPTLPVSHVLGLLRSSADVALGPAADGGFYAIACSRVHEKMFAGIEWSRADTLERCLAAVRSCGLTADVGAEWYDIDDADSLAHLLSAPNVPQHTKQWVSGCR